ncbi:MAG: 4Fe-4S dicluster domain-containing protein [Planctomycetes bacterium]|nr:4Fe-4S dicluster domain-containing protein [Planctomycetota bacterium]
MTGQEAQSPNPGKKNDSPVDRRDFFKEVIRSVMQPAAEFLDRRLKPLMPEEETPGDYLRPPGALYEHQFRTTCSRCGKCAQVCPVQAIRIMKSDDPALDGTPYIVPSLKACVVCDSLACMNICPSGALKPVPKEEIRMGLACMRYETCVRTRGEDCRICVEKCPLGPRAIVLHEGRVEIIVSGCVGCGVCENQCPTSPRAIHVEPA